ncbi:iron-sulfur cluster assembly scaffold protein [Kiritimatiella glycovorans]|uniref:NifU-like protein n=1 Tax=Kiritimatiella glycovorans TaxID=1307763 RepID=A0A0G3ECJ7_9BACT|nr:iron-sulfur cluster assembly scaffold protein [Kiritimatiella glycovorans]AKJ64023.1 NifU-like protein [Kiritimatiella glycovorans]
MNSFSRAFKSVLTGRRDEVVTDAPYEDSGYIRWARVRDWCGRIEDPSATATVKGPCGDAMTIDLDIAEGVLRRARFETDGCAATYACGSLACSKAEGLAVLEALRIHPRMLLGELDGIPGDHLHCAILTCTALYRALALYLLARDPQSSSFSGT